MDKPNMAAGKFANQAEQHARNAANNAWVRTLGRLGYAAKGLVYILIGGLAAFAALGNGGQTTDRKGAIQVIYEQPFGKLLLGIVAVGLFGYALWKFVEAAMDTEGKGSEPKGIAMRLVYIGVGISYAALAFAALQLIMGTGNTGQNSDSTTQDWTARVLNWPLGTPLVVIGGLIVLGVAVYQLYKGISTKFEKRLDLSQLSAKAKQSVLWLGRLGFGARGIVFGIIGVFLILAALQHNPGEAKGIGGALQTLAGQPFGQILLGVVAIGLAAYGVFSLVEARYRRFGWA